MGKKRKHRDRDNSDRILRRIEKLEKRLSKRQRKSYSNSRSSSPDSGSSLESPKRIHFYNEHEVCSSDDGNESPPSTHANGHNDRDDTTRQPSKSATATPANEDDKNSTSAEAENLDDDILTILGDPPKDESPVGKDVHKDIASRLKDVLENGLKKELKDKITEEYPIPGNCSLFKAPVLNEEIKAAVSDILQKKDASLAARQGQMGIALTALTAAMDILVSEKSDTNQLLLKHISNASRLICDSHFIDTKMRRNFLISTLNNKLKETLKDSKRDKYLFGEVLPEKLKANKAISKCGQDLKSFKPKPVMTKNPATSSSTNNLNWKHPQPNPQNAHRRPTAMPHHRTAGPAANRRSEPPRKTTTSRASKNNAHYSRHQRRY